MAHDVIIIDDEKDVSEVIEGFCEQVGIFRHIIKAYDGIEASIKLNNQNFSLIIVDINLPKKNGIDLLRAISDSANNSIKSVLLISGELHKDHLSKAVQLGVKHFLVKPFSLEMLKKKIDTIMEL